MSVVFFESGDTLKQLNRSLILKEIRKRGPVTKIELANKFDLSFPSAGNIITELLHADLIKETGYGESKGGRRPILYGMKWDSVHVIALMLGVEEITASVVNMKGEIPHEVTADADTPVLIEKVYALIDQLLEEKTINRSKIVGIGVSAPGPIDASNGKILTPPNLEGVHNLNIQHLLEERYELPTVLEKDANAFALAEQWFGNIKSNEDILYVFNDQGLGGGLVVDSRIHRGFANGAGEIGHMTIDINGPRCKCGNFGCLETLGSGIAIQRRFKEELRRGYPSTLAHEYLHDEKDITIDMIVKEAKKGDDLSKQILHEAGRNLGLGIANAINLFTPNQIVFGGKVTMLYPNIIKIVEEVAKQRTFSPYSKEIAFSESEFSHQSNTIGAAAVIQQKLFDNPEAIIK